MLLFGLTAVICYCLLLVAVELRREEKRDAMDGFDLNHNGLLSGKELTPAAHHAVREAASDTGLILAPITGIVYSLAWTTLAYLVAGWHGWYSRHRGNAGPLHF